MAKHRTDSPWDRHLARDRARSAEKRKVAKETGRPSPYQVAVAIADATRLVWAANVDKLGGPDDPVTRRAALGEPIPLDRIAERAVDILVTEKRADRAIAGRMVIARIRPKAAPPIRVPKAAEPLTTPLVAYR
jgi:hypothetical protein